MLKALLPSLNEQLNRLILSQKTISFFLIVALLSGFYYLFSPRPDAVFSGTVEINEYYLGAAAPGRLSKRYADEGNLVEAGQKLATLERYDQALRDLERAELLYQANATSEQDYEYSKLALEDQLIRSPVSGVVLQKLVDEGEVIAAGSRVFIIGDTSAYWVKIFVPQSLINKIRMGMIAHIHIDGISERISGHVNYISPFAEFTPRAVQTPDERASQTFAVKVYFDKILPTLRPGITADVVFKDL